MLYAGITYKRDGLKKKPPFPRRQSFFTTFENKIIVNELPRSVDAFRTFSMGLLGFTGNYRSAPNLKSLITINRVWTCSDKNHYGALAQISTGQPHFSGFFFSTKLIFYTLNVKDVN